MGRPTVPSPAPDVSVVVASHGRTMRLRWLLGGHPLSASGRLRQILVPPSIAEVVVMAYGGVRERTLVL